MCMALLLRYGRSRETWKIWERMPYMKDKTKNLHHAINCTINKLVSIAKYERRKKKKTKKMYQLIGTYTSNWKV
jgi:hypothetical protein